MGSPYRDRQYLDWLRSQPCIITGRRGTDSDPVEAAHIGTMGKGIKSPDYHALPISHSLHAMGHQGGEISMLREHLPDYVLREALRLYAEMLYAEYLNQ